MLRKVPEVSMSAMQSEALVCSDYTVLLAKQSCMTPVPQRDQGIFKAEAPRLRKTVIELAGGSRIYRETLNALNRVILDGDIKTVVVWKPDRIARTQKEGINTFYDWCDAGVRVVSVTQQIDLSGTVGRIVAGVDPQACLTTVLSRVADHKINHIEELT